MGFAMGPFACSSREGARPSQNCARAYAWLIIVGALRFPFCDLIPVDTAAPSVNANFGSWHEAHDNVSSADKRLSKYNKRPSSTLAGEYGFCFGQENGGRPAGMAT